ncbi:MAG: hypothetical protein KDJ97_37135 [Anaerolineae bacterium]|nr:hypothetical protein [Anaerolineae bacterium]
MEYNAKTTGRIDPAADPERAAMFMEVYGSYTIPLLSFVPSWQSLPIGERLCYLVNLRAITPDQRRRLVDYIARRFDIDPASVEADLDQIGMPVLTEHITVTSSDQGLLLSMMDDRRLNSDDPDDDLENYLYEDKEDDWEEEWDDYDEWDDYEEWGR